MTNYNDGRWWGWNGGECPVHPETEVECIMLNDHRYGSKKAGILDWNLPNDFSSSIVAFRVVKEHREPREWWLINAQIFVSAREAKTAYPGSNPVLFREVIE